LAYIFCCKEAGLPIKSYSPENIVLPILRTMAEAEQDFHIAPGDSLTTEQYEQAKEQIVEDLKAWIKPLHALVIGPGLGRDPLVLSCAMAAVSAARDRDLPVVLDGDALFALNDDLDIVQGYTRCVLTPNPAEYRRLYLSVAASLESNGEVAPPPLSPSEHSNSVLDQPNSSEEPSGTEESHGMAESSSGSKQHLEVPQSESVMRRSNSNLGESQASLAPLTLPDDEESIWSPKSVKTIAAALGGVTIIRKGQTDVISDGRRLIQCHRPGGLRRCGGQGDILAGITGTMLGWNFGSQSAYENAERVKKREGHRFTASRTMLAAWGACSLTREASHRAYEEHHRGTTTPHILNHIGPAFYDLCEHYSTAEADANSKADYIQELL
jgi:NAD(P)H-hydrate repair Nnr-like enzyme with NAD(P)H-hydrate dehydratase domain